MKTRVVVSLLGLLLLGSCSTVAKTQVINSPSSGTIPFSGATAAVIVEQSLYTTEDFQLFHFSPQTIRFRMRLPVEWTLRGSTLFNANNVKVAELSPGFVDPKGRDPFGLIPAQGESILGPDSEIQTLSKQRIFRSGIEAVKVVESGLDLGGPRPSKLVSTVYYAKVPPYSFVFTVYYLGSRAVDDAEVFSILKSLEILEK